MQLAILLRSNMQSAHYWTQRSEFGSMNCAIMLFLNCIVDSSSSNRIIGILHPWPVTFLAQLPFVPSRTLASERFNWIPDHRTTIMTFVDFSSAKCLENRILHGYVSTGIEKRSRGPAAKRPLLLR